MAADDCSRYAADAANAEIALYSMAGAGFAVWAAAGWFILIS